MRLAREGLCATSKRRARGDPLRRRLREPNTHATCLWRSLSARGHHSMALLVAVEGSAPREEHHDPLAQGIVAFRFRLGTRGTRCPKRLARRYRAVFPQQLPIPGRRPWDGWQGGPFHRSHRTAPSRARAALSVRHPGRATPLGAFGRVLDPSIEGVQPTCQRSAPGIRVGCRLLVRDVPASVAVHAASPTSTRPVAHHFGFLFRRGARQACLWRSWVSRSWPAFRHSPAARAPRRPPKLTA